MNIHNRLEQMARTAPHPYTAEEEQQILAALEAANVVAAAALAICRTVTLPNGPMLHLRQLVLEEAIRELQANV